MVGQEQAANFDWRLVISLVTLVLIIFSTLWGTNLLARKERVKIKIDSVHYGIDDGSGTVNGRGKIKIYWGGEFCRSGEKDIRYITEIRLIPDQQTYDELRQYFNLPADGVIRINDRWELPRSKIASSRFGDDAAYSDYDAIIQAKDTEEWKVPRQLASTLAEKTIEIGLVWDDSRKTTWKTIPKEKFGEWV